jgi:hypothetical protein
MEQLYFAQRAAMERVHGGHRTNKVVVPVADQVLVAVVAEIIRTPDLN